MLEGIFRLAGREAPPTFSIVLSMPPKLRGELKKLAPSAQESRPAIETLIRSAARTLDICCPYVDAAFTGLISPIDARIRIVTTAHRDRGKLEPNNVLERCATLRDLGVRYLIQEREGAFLHQVHAKIVIADGARAYIGSVNLTDTSLHYNFEAGVITQDPGIVKELAAVIDALYCKVAVTGNQL